jgi:hypothetical protein
MPVLHEARVNRPLRNLDWILSNRWLTSNENQLLGLLEGNSSPYTIAIGGIEPPVSRRVGRCPNNPLDDMASTVRLVGANP